MFRLPGILSTMFLLVLQSFESFFSCSSKLSFSCCWVLAAISSFLASLNSSNVFWCSNSVAVHLLKKLFQDIQYFTTLTGILRHILAGSSGLRSLRICPVFFGTIRTTLQFVNSIEFSISEDIDLLSLNIRQLFLATNCYHIGTLVNLGLSKQFLVQRVNFFSDNRTHFCTFFGMLVSSVEILSLSAVVCSSEIT